MNALARQLLRTPAVLYRCGAGWLLGERFLLLTHVGRRTGRRYRTPLEVIGSGKLPGEVIVLVGLGDRADWLRNVRANEALEITVGRRRFAPLHRQLDQTEAEAVLAGYEHRNRWAAPVVRRLLSWLVGWHYDGSESARRQLIQQLPLIAFRPQRPGSTHAPT